MDFDLTGLTTGPSSSVTLAPALAKSSAIACPNSPVDWLLMTRIESIGTHVGPQVIKTFLFFNKFLEPNFCKDSFYIRIKNDRVSDIFDRDIRIFEPMAGYRTDNTRSFMIFKITLLA